MGVWFGGWMGGLMARIMSNQKKLIKLDLMKIIQFCLKIYDLWTHSPPLGQSVGGFMPN